MTSVEARKVLLAAMAAVLRGDDPGAATLLEALDDRARDAVLGEAVVIAADLLARLDGRTGIAPMTTGTDPELLVIGSSVRSALVSLRHNGTVD